MSYDITTPIGQLRAMAREIFDKDIDHRRSNQYNRLADEMEAMLEEARKNAITEEVRKQINKQMKLRERYDKEIMSFFMGQTFFGHTEKGFIWTSNHEKFDTLTVEPPEGGQYEVAIRVPMPESEKKENNSGAKYQGYIAGPGYFFGIEVGGH